MKRFLLTAALILALVTSLTAGTMAAYTQKVETIEAGIQTKSFSITADQTSTSFKQDVKIAPGDTVSYKVKVNNASEVRSDVTVQAALSTNYQGMSVSIAAAAGSKDNDQTSIDGGTAETEMAVQGNQEYIITVAWDYSKGLTKDAGQSTTLKIDINGTQVNGENVLTASDTKA